VVRDVRTVIALPRTWPASKNVKRTFAMGIERW
jgi:hypothetical protein